MSLSCFNEWKNKKSYLVQGGTNNKLFKPVVVRTPHLNRPYHGQTNDGQLLKTSSILQDVCQFLHLFFYDLPFVFVWFKERGYDRLGHTIRLQNYTQTYYYTDTDTNHHLLTPVIIYAFHLYNL